MRARVPDPGSVDATARGRRRVSAVGTDTLRLGEHDVDVRAVRQFTDAGQVAGAGLVLDHAVTAGHLDGRRPLPEVLDRLEADLAGPTARWTGGAGTDVAVPRRHEVAAALNRLRALQVRELH
ncbi:hypothetical protein [Kineococcus sp. NPDC059986]|uniref:hypothetical protein n=1 Tax=Kineococcus sp. NPDC059986 TaxID=3155538 RepID=UPI00344D11FD